MGNQHTSWSAAEVVILRQLYPVAAQQAICDALPGRSWLAAAGYAKRLKLKRTAFSTRPWSPDDLATLTEQYRTVGPQLLAQQLGRSLAGIYVQAGKMGLSVKNKQHVWSAANEALVREHYPTGMPTTKLAALIGTRPMNVVSFAHSKGIARLVRAKTAHYKKRRSNAWSEEHLAILCCHYPSLGADHVAALVGRSHAAVVRMAQQHQLRRTCVNLTHWSAIDAALVRKHWPAGMPMAELVALLGRPASTITNYCVYHKIPRTLRAQRPKQAPMKRPAKVVQAKPVQAKPVQAKPVPHMTADATKFAQLSKSIKYGPTPIANKPKVVAAPVAQHQPARLSNLIAQKSLQKKKKAAAATREVSVAYIKSLPYQHPESHHYRMGGERAVLQYRAQLTGQAA